MWELPGGKVMTRTTEEVRWEEPPKNALIREWEEELGVVILPSMVGPLLASSFLDVEVSFVVDLYPVLVDRHFRPRPIDHVELRWVDPTYAVKHMPCSPAYYLHYKAIVAWCREMSGLSCYDIGNGCSCAQLATFFREFSK